MLCRFQFRTQALTNFFHSVKREVSAALGPERVCKMGVGPRRCESHLATAARYSHSSKHRRPSCMRSAAFGALCGYDFAALAGGDNPVDILLPKHCERPPDWKPASDLSEP